MSKLKADRLPFQKATEADINTGVSQRVVYAPELKKAIDNVTTVVSDLGIDEYDSNDFKNAASVGAVAQLREWVTFLLDATVKTPETIVTDGLVYIDGQNQGGIDLRILPIELPFYGTIINPPIYKFINGGFWVRIFMGDATVPFFEEQQLNSPATLVPFKDENNQWAYSVQLQ